MNDKEMIWVEHLGELRSRLIKTLLWFMLMLGVSLIGVKPIYQWLVRDLDYKLAILGPSDIIWVYMMIAGVLAISATIPVAAYQTWQFVCPALAPKERKTALSFIPALSILFAAGIAFGYFILFPMVYSFLESLASDFETVYTAEKYFRFLVHMTVPFGFLFEMPVVVLFLTQIGLLNPKRLAKARKLAYFLLAIIAITITPPDIMSDVLVLIPLFLLYEISVTISRFAYRRRLRAGEAVESQL